MSQLLIETDTLMPPFGVAQLLVDVTRLDDAPNPLVELTSTDLFRFWLQTHTEPMGAPFWRTAVLRECLPDPVSDLEFVALAPIECRVPRTALVRVALTEVKRP